MDASDKSFYQLGQNDLTVHQVISSVFLISFCFYILSIRFA